MYYFFCTLCLLSTAQRFESDCKCREKLSNLQVFFGFFSKNVVFSCFISVLGRF